MIDLHKIRWPDFYSVEVGGFQGAQSRLNELQSQMMNLFSEKCSFIQKKYGYKIDEDFESKTEEVVVDIVNKILKSDYKYIFDFEQLIPQLYTTSRDKAFEIINKWEEEAIAAETEPHRQNRAITVLEGISDNCKYIGDGVQEVNSSVQDVKDSIDALGNTMESVNNNVRTMKNIAAYRRRLF